MITFRASGRDRAGMTALGANGGNCVEVGHAGILVAIRDTNGRGGPELHVRARRLAPLRSHIKSRN